MSNINELIFLSDFQNGKPTKFGGIEKAKNSKQALLYQILFNSPNGDENDIAQKIYDDETVDSSSKKYIKLKSRLKQKMMQSLFFVEPNDKHKKQTINANKQIYLGKILCLLKTYQLGINNLQKGISIAENTEQFDLVLDASNQLMKIGHEIDDRALYKAACANVDKYKQLSKTQTLFQRKYFDILDSIKENGSKASITRNINDAIETFEATADIDAYFTFTSLYYRLQSVKFKHKQDYQSLLINSLMAIESLNRFEDIPSDDLYYFKESYLIACKKLQAFHKGNLFIEKIKTKQFIKPLDVTDQLVNKFKIYFEFGNCNFEEVEKNIHYFLRSKRYKKVDTIDVAHWNLFSSYVQLGQKLQASIDESTDLPVLRYSKLLTKLEPLKKDKQGLNIAVLALKLIIDLCNDNLDEIHDRIDALKIYRSRYLKGNEHKRAHAFFTLFINLEKNAFNFKNAEEANNDLYQTLKHSKESFASQEYELIPFDKIWDYLVALKK